MSDEIKRTLQKLRDKADYGTVKIRVPDDNLHLNFIGDGLGLLNILKEALDNAGMDDYVDAIKRHIQDMKIRQCFFIIASDAPVDIIKPEDEREALQFLSEDDMEIDGS